MRLTLLRAVYHDKPIAHEREESFYVQTERHRHFANICLHFVLESSQLYQLCLGLVVAFNLLLWISSVLKDSICSNLDSANRLESFLSIRESHALQSHVVFLIKSAHFNMKSIFGHLCSIHHFLHVDEHVEYSMLHQAFQVCYLTILAPADLEPLV